ncbi:hypothetical protein GGX14DRAFT_386276 [Mycena pura]|uniref:Uncharacterized protein n=1 Tax=Mycena pura TaxID=153505 RepID=A0AAD7E2N6_9AGAR|nr:hypothetical protein GGX14DRAFT_386276 [Mycena pura]
MSLSYAALGHPALGVGIKFCSFSTREDLKADFDGRHGHVYRRAARESDAALGARGHSRAGRAARNVTWQLPALTGTSTTALLAKAQLLWECAGRATRNAAQPTQLSLRHAQHPHLTVPRHTPPAIPLPARDGARARTRHRPPADRARSGSGSARAAVAAARVMLGIVVATPLSADAMEYGVPGAHGSGSTRKGVQPIQSHYRHHIYVQHIAISPNICITLLLGVYNFFLSKSPAERP